MRNLAAALVLLGATAAWADNASDVEGIAKKYLDALTGEGSEENRELLLGGASMMAQIASLENWRIVSKDPIRHEKADMAKARKLMEELDASGKAAHAKLLDSVSGGDDLGVTELSAAQASKLLAPTKAKAQKFKKAHPVISYIARVDKEVYWHPLNPIRKVLAKAGDGPYEAEVHRIIIESKEGPNQTPRRWPLKVVRIKTAQMDTGWKVLPASDWSPD